MKTRTSTPKATADTIDRLSNEVAVVRSLANSYAARVDSIFNVRQFGAKGDGSSDDLAAFRAAIAAINAQGGGTLFVPPGTYALDIIHTAPLDLTKTIQLCGNLTIVMTPKTVIQVSGSWSAGKYYTVFGIFGSGLYSDANNISIYGNGASIVGVNPNQANDPAVVHGLLFNDETTENITVRDLTVRDCGTNAKFNGIRGFVVNCQFLNGNNNCVAVTDASDWVYDGCTFSGCTAPAGGNCVQAGIDLEPNTGEEVKRIKIVNCTASGNGKKGIYFQQGAGTSSEIVVANCDIRDNADYGLAIVGTDANRSTDNVVSGNRFTGNGTSGVTNASSMLLGYVRGGSVVGNVVNGNSTSYGIRLTYCEQVSIAGGNTVNGCGGSTNVAAITLVSCRNTHVTGNSVTNGAENAVYINGGSNVIVSDNHIATFGKQLVYIRGGAAGLLFSDNLLAEPCQTSGSEFVLGSVEDVGEASFIGNSFTQSTRYLSGTVASYSAGGPTIGFDSVASSQTNYYVGAYVLVGAERIAITAYNGTTRVATLASAFSSAPTPGSSTYTVVSARTCSIGVNSGRANNKTWTLANNDFVRSGVSVPGYSVTAASISITWPAGGIKTVSADYTATLFDETILVDATSAARTVTLPTTANGRCMNKIYTIKKIDSSGNAVTIDANASETIDGALTQTLASQWNALTLKADSSTWSVLSAK